MPRFLRSRAAVFVALGLSALFLGATPEAPFDALRAIPAGALAVATMGDPSAALRNAVGFLRNAGFEDQAASLAELAESPDAEGDAAAVLAGLDLRRRVAIAVYPGDDDVPAALVFLPLRSRLSEERREELYGALPGAFGADGASLSVAIDYPGYVVVGAGGMDVPAYGTPGAIDLSRLSTHPASSLVAWFDPGATAAYLERLTGGLSSIFGDSARSLDDELDYWRDQDRDDVDESAPAYDPLVDNAPPAPRLADSPDGPAQFAAPAFDPLVDNAPPGAAAVDDPSEAAEEDEYEEDYAWDEAYPDDLAEHGSDGESIDPTVDTADGLAAALAEILEAGLDELASVEIAISIRPERAWLRVGASISPGGQLAAMAAKASAGDRSLPYLRYCEADALMSFAWSAPQDLASPILEALYGLAMPDASLAETALDAARASSAAAGMNGAMSIGLSLSEEILEAIKRDSQASDENPMALIERGLGVSLSGALELADRQAFRDAAALSMDILKHPSYQDLLSGSGLSFTVERAKGLVDGAPFDRYGYRFEPLGDDGAEDRAAQAAAIAGRLLSPVYLYRGDNAYLTLGPPAAAYRAAARDAAERPLGLDPAFRALRAGASPNARAVWYLSSKALARLTVRALPDDRLPLPFNVNALSGLLGWLEATPLSMGFGLGVGAEDVKAVAALAR